MTREPFKHRIVYPDDRLVAQRPEMDMYICPRNNLTLVLRDTCKYFDRYEVVDGSMHDECGREPWFDWVWAIYRLEASNDPEI